MHMSVLVVFYRADVHGFSAWGGAGYLVWKKYTNFQTSIQSIIKSKCSQLLLNNKIN